MTVVLRSAVVGRSGLEFYGFGLFLKLYCLGVKLYGLGLRLCSCLHIFLSPNQQRQITDAKKTAAGLLKYKMITEVTL